MRLILGFLKEDTNTLLSVVRANHYMYDIVIPNLYDTVTINERNWLQVTYGNTVAKQDGTLKGDRPPLIHEQHADTSRQRIYHGPQQERQSHGSNSQNGSRCPAGLEIYPTLPSVGRSHHHHSLLQAVPQPPRTAREQNDKTIIEKALRGYHLEKLERDCTHRSGICRARFRT